MLWKCTTVNLGDVFTSSLSLFILIKLKSLWAVMFYNYVHIYIKEYRLEFCSSFPGNLSLLKGVPGKTQSIESGNERGTRNNERKPVK